MDLLRLDGVEEEDPGVLVLGPLLAGLLLVDQAELVGFCLNKDEGFTVKSIRAKSYIFQIPRNVSSKFIW